MAENGCPCKGLKTGVIHFVALFVVVFLAVTAAICAANQCPWCQGKLLQSTASAPAPTSVTK